MRFDLIGVDEGGTFVIEGYFEGSALGESVLHPLKESGA